MHEGRLLIFWYSDTLVIGNIKPEETTFLMSPEGIYPLQLTSDLYPIFAKKYLHRVDSDLVLSGQTKGIAMKKVENSGNWMV